MTMIGVWAHRYFFGRRRCHHLFRCCSVIDIIQSREGRIEDTNKKEEARNTDKSHRPPFFWPLWKVNSFETSRLLFSSLYISFTEWV